jgi:beta-lactamase regulating signal transducer with metallopeptidase domain
MFAARGIAVSFSVFVLVYCALSLAVCCGWRRLWLFSQKYPVRRSADLLFGLRVLPLATAGVVTAVFTVPSFLLLEPRSIDEAIGGIPLALGFCGCMLAAFGAANAAVAVAGASRRIAEWQSEAKLVDASGPVPVLRISRVIPALTAAGILRPKVLLSSTAEFVLTAKELQTALRHELAHVRRRDNLKKLALRFVAFPGMAGLEQAWLEATEMAADDAAVSSSGEALDLAAALIKLSRFSPAEPPTVLTMSLVHRPAASVNARVERLIAWSESRKVPERRYSMWYALGAGLAMMAAFGVTYSQLLMHVHTATEWLVR